MSSTTIYTYYVYAYLREDGTPYYIGKGSGNRIYTPGSRAVKMPTDHSRIIRVATGLNEDEAFLLEKKLIAQFGRKDLGTGILRNLTDGGEGISGYRHAEETKAKIRASNKRSGRVPHNKGKTCGPLSTETKAKISAALKGRTISEEHRENMRTAKKGFKHSEEARAKISAATKGVKRSPLSDEHKAKLSAAGRGRTHSEETKQKMRESYAKRKANAKT